MMKGENDIMYYSDSIRQLSKSLKRCEILTCVFAATTIIFGATAGYVTYQCDYLSTIF
jgi:hypothetical protein